MNKSLDDSPTKLKMIDSTMMSHVSPIDINPNINPVVLD